MIEQPFLVLQSDSELAERLARVARSVDLTCRLPDRPFLDRSLHVGFAQYMRLVGSDFIPVLEALCAAHGDERVLLLTLDPAPGYYREHYGYFAAIEIELLTLADCYWSALNFTPVNDPAGAIGNTASTLTVTGSSGRWTVWGSFNWDVALVATESAEGPWTDVGVPFVTGQQAIDWFVQPSWDEALPAPQAQRFLGNLSTVGEEGLRLSRRGRILCVLGMASDAQRKSGHFPSKRRNAP